MSENYKMPIDPISTKHLSMQVTPLPLMTLLIYLKLTLYLSLLKHDLLVCILEEEKKTEIGKYVPHFY